MIAMLKRLWSDEQGEVSQNMVWVALLSALAIAIAGTVTLKVTGLGTKFGTKIDAVNP